MACYMMLLLLLLAGGLSPCSGDEQFTWSSLSYRLTQLRARLLGSFISRTTEYGRRWLASPHKENPVNEIIRLIRLLVETLNSACLRLRDLRDDKVDERCREDMALSVCAFGYLLNGTVTKILHVCSALIDDVEKERCHNETDKWIYGNLWAIRFIDALGKIPSGILDGNLIFLGNYAECSKLEVPRSENSSQERNASTTGGRNCVVQFGLPPLPERVVDVHWEPDGLILRRSLVAEPLFRWGICVPSTCMAQDVERLSDVAMPGLTSAGMRVRCEEDSLVTNDACAVVAIMFGVILLLLVTVASFFDFWRQLDSSPASAKTVNSRSSSPNTFSMDVVSEEDELPKGNALVKTTGKDGWIASLLLSFSAFTNIRRLSHIDDSRLSYLNGIRCLSIMYAIFGYACMFALNNLDNALVGMDMIGEFKSQLVNSAALSADTFFVLSGCLASYWYFKRICSDPTSRTTRWVRLLVRRLLRLLPMYLMIFVSTVVLFKHFGSGPLWDGDIPLESSQEGCAKSWWTNLLFLQNFLYVDQPCFGWSWFVAVEMQCFLVALAFLWLLSRCPRWGLALAALATAGLAICHLIMVVCNDYPPSYLGTTNLKELKKLEEYMRNVFIKPYTHGCSYLIGICLGYLLVKLKTKAFRMKALPKSCILSSIVVVNAATVFGVYDYANGRSWSLVEKGMYASLSRLTWPLTVAALIVWCRLFPKSTISRMLSMDCWNPLAQLTYGAALVHPLVIAGLLLTLRDTFHLSVLNAAYNGISATVISYLVAFVLYLCIEGPILNMRDRYLSMEMSQRSPLGF